MQPKGSTQTKGHAPGWKGTCMWCPRHMKSHFITTWNNSHQIVYYK